MSTSSTEWNSIISSTYATANSKNADMKLAIELIEPMKSSLSNDGLFQILKSMDAAVGRAEVQILQPILIETRKELTQMIVRNNINDLKKQFAENATSGWNRWLEIFTEALYLQRTDISLSLLNEQFPFPQNANVVLKEIGLYKDIIKDNWVDAYDLYVLLSNQVTLSGALRQYMYVLAGLVDLWVFLFPEKAKLKFDKAKDASDSQSSTVLCAYGEYNLAHENFKEAIDDFSLAIKVNPTGAWGYTGIAECYERQNEFMTAEEYYQEAVRKCPGITLGYRKLCQFYGRPELFNEHESQVLDFSKSIIALDPELKYDIFLMIGTIYLRNRNFAKAFDWISNAIEQDERRYVAYISRGLAYFEQGLNHEAYLSFVKANEVAPNSFDGSWSLSWYFESLSDWAAALEWYKKSLPRRPQWKAIILAKIGEMKWKLKDYDGAEGDIRNALELESQNPQISQLAHNIAIESLTTLGDPARALKIYKDILRVKGDDYFPDYHRNIASVYAFQKDWKAANKSISQAFDLDKDDILYHKNLADLLILEGNDYFNSKDIINANKKYEISLKHYEEVLSKNEQDVESLIGKGNVFYNLGKYEDAIRFYDQALQNNAIDATLWINKGDSHYILEQLDEAIACYDKAISIAPNYIDPYIRKGIALRDLRKPEEAIKCFDSALQLDRQNDLTWYNLGQAFFENNQLDKALDAFDEALKIDSSYPDTWVAKGDVLYASTDIEGALVAYNEALKLQPNNRSALLNKAQILLDMRKYSEAIDWYDKALVSEPDDMNALVNKGLALYNLGKYNEAIECYDKALAIEPNDVTTLSNKGLAIDKLGKYNEALECYDKALAIDPNSVTAIDNKGYTLSNMGDFDKALELVDKAIAIDPSNANAWYNKSCYMAVKGYKDEALNSLAESIKLDRKYIDLAKTDTDLDRLKDDIRFKRLTAQES